MSLDLALWLIDIDEDVLFRLPSRTGDRTQRLTSDQLAARLAALGSNQSVLICLGGTRPSTQTLDTLASAARRGVGHSLILACEGGLECIHDQPELTDRVTYAFPGRTEGEPLARLLALTVEQLGQAGFRQRAWQESVTRSLQSALSLNEFAESLARSIQKDGIAQAVAVWIHDTDRKETRRLATWPESAQGEKVARSGLVGFVASSGQSAVAECGDGGALDPRLVAAIDHPWPLPIGISASITATDPNPRYRLLLSLSVTGDHLLLEPDIRRYAGALDALAPTLERLLAQERFRATTGNLFRPDAIRKRYQAQPEFGALLQGPPRWTRYGFRTLSVGLTMLLAIAAFGSIGQYASGPALLVDDTHIEVRSEIAGVVAWPLLSTGAAIVEGTALVQFDDTAERNELEAAEREFARWLRRRLQRPDDESLRPSLIAARDRLFRAETARDRKVLRAPHAGEVGAMHVIAGQSVQLGQTVITLRIDSADAGLSSRRILALIPAASRPQLRTGASMRVELDGYDYAYVESTVESISADVIGPEQMRTRLGERFADAFTLTGPLVLVEGSVGIETLRTGKGEIPLMDGMPGSADVELERTSLWRLLFPWLTRR